MYRHMDAMSTGVGRLNALKASKCKFKGIQVFTQKALQIVFFNFKILWSKKHSDHGDVYSEFG